MFFITGLIIGFGWGLVVARWLVLGLMRVAGAIEEASLLT